MENLYETWYAIVTEDYRGTLEDHTNIQLRECVHTFSPVKDLSKENKYGFKRWETKQVETKAFRKMIRKQGRENTMNGIKNAINYEMCKKQVLAKLGVN